MSLSERAPLAISSSETAREFPEARPLNRPFAYLRDAWANAAKHRLGRCGYVMLCIIWLAMLLGLAGLVFILVNPGPPTACLQADAAAVGTSICTPAYVGYELVEALHGQLPREKAETYLRSWPTSLATRYMADTAMYRWQLQANATSSAFSRVSSSVLAKLVASEPVPAGAATWCAVHLGSEASGAEGQLGAVLARRNASVAQCPTVTLLASAAVTGCSPAALHASQARVQSARTELCSRGYATAVHLGGSPDATVALLSRARSSLSLDAAIDELVAGVRAALLHGSTSARRAATSSSSSS